MPLPDKLTACGLPLALSLMLSEAVSLPLAVGVNVTLIVQLAPAASELPQVLVWAKALALAPVIATLVMLNVAVPLFVRVTVEAALLVPTAWLLKETLVGERLTAGAVPVPERLTVCGLPLALSVMLTEAARLPVAVGVKVTLMPQFAPAPTVLPQLLL